MDHGLRNWGESNKVMGRSIASAIFGSLLGCGVCFLAWTGLAFFGSELPSIGFYLFTILGAAFGGWLGSRGGPVTRWSGALALAVGGIGFVAGYCGVWVFLHDLAQARLFSIFVTGPYGAILGAMVGLTIGAFRERRLSALAGSVKDSGSRKRKARRGRKRRG
jgi:hypothetical protein